MSLPKVLVVGASGPTGREIVKRVASRGHDVVALVRHAGGDAPRGDRIEARQGDVLDRKSLTSALEGCDVVLCALGSGISLRPMTLLSTGTRNLVDAMRAAGVRRLVCITGVGAGDSRGHGRFVYDKLILPTILRQVYRDKDRQEQVVRDSGLDWTIVRPAGLTDGPARGAYRVITDLAGVTAGKISRADVADFMVKQIANTNYVGRTPLLTD